MAEQKAENDNEEVAQEPPATPEAVREVIEHTDSGSGASQKDHWPAEEPGEAH